ncbi:MAG: tripartite tricarboxylate transporter substrate binding protein, partial [Burkholderiales bacterium]
YGYYGPANISQDLARRLYAEAARALGGPDVREKLARSGNEYVMSLPEEFTAFIRAEIAKWTKLVKETNIRIE